MTDRQQRRRIRHWRTKSVEVLAALLLAAFVGIRFGTPVYGRYRTIVKLKSSGIEIAAQDRNSSPLRKWLLKWVGTNWRAVLCSALDVDVSGARATDEDLHSLASFDNLWAVHLRGSPITDAGLAHLNELTNLRVLTIEGTRITDDGLGHLEGMPHLTQLELTGTRTTDLGLRYIAKLKSLKLLGLKRVPVTDAGVARLAPLSNLRLLYYTKTKITATGIAKLKGSLPTCQFDCTESARQK